MIPYATGLTSEFSGTITPSNAMLDEHLRILCEQAAQEQDQKRLFALICQINQYLEERDARAKAVGNTLRGKSA